jgi:hypothetical protein
MFAVRKDNIVLHVMQKQDMFRVHPRTDWSFTCDQCQQGVGIYPSGQAMIKKIGRSNLKIICNRCLGPQNHGFIPGEILEEIKDSVPHQP